MPRPPARFIGLIWMKRLSQKRSTCCGTSISSATSLMVRNASGALSNALTLYRPSLLAAAVRFRIDSLLEDSRRLEHHDPARRDRHFLAGLGIAADALALLAHHERAERRQFHRFATFEAVGDFLQHKFYECRGFGARQAALLVDRLTQIRTRDCLSRHRQPRARRSIQRRSTYRAELSTILAWRRRCQPGFSRSPKVTKPTSAPVPLPR